MRPAISTAARRRGKASSARFSPGTTLERREPDSRIARVLLQKVAELLLLAGVDASDLRVALAHAERHAKRQLPKLSSRSAPFDGWRYARVLSAWHRTPEYTDENGVGKPLSMKGKHGFESLVAKALPRAKPHRVLASLKALGAVRISSNRLVTPTSRSLIVEQRTEMTLLRALDLCDALISTIHSNWLNYGSSKADRCLFERAVIAEKFDLRYLRALDGLVRVHGQALLELLDGWLAEHEVRGGARSGGEAQVGVEIFLFAKRAGRQ